MGRFWQPFKQIINNSGLMNRLNREELEENIGEARSLITEELTRTRDGFEGVGGSRATADPGKKTAMEDGMDLSALKEDYPSLSKYSDQFLKATPLETLLKLTATKLKMSEIEKGRGAEERLTANRSKLAGTQTKVVEGTDNRWDKLHPARFLPGAACSAAKSWLAAREVIGETGVVPISTYDMGAVGLAGYVTARGWLEIHNPASTSISIKMFNINNCGTRTTGLKGKTEEENVGIEDLGELKLAVRAAREAMNFAMPWNRSIAALDGFFHMTNFCHTDLVGLEKPGLLLSQFIDYILWENANKWRGQEPFLSAGDIKTYWAAFFSGRPQAHLQKAKVEQAKPPWQQRQQSSSWGRGGGPNFTTFGGKGFFDDICGLWNMGRCLKAPGTCLTSKGVPLRHVCNYRQNMMDPTVVCAKDHARTSFHK
jgi:hypothetical protein